MGVWVGCGGWGRKNVHVDCKQKQMLTWHDATSYVTGYRWR